MFIKAAPNIKFEIIDELTSHDNNLLNINMLCEIAGVSRSGFYDWRKAKRNHTTQEDADRADLELILWAYNFRGYKKGARSIYMRLLRKKVRMNIKKILAFITQIHQIATFQY